MPTYPNLIKDVIPCGITNLHFPKSDAVIVGGYRIARKIFKFN